MLHQGGSVRLSLIVCTRNRASRLREFFAPLNSLEQPHGGWELIVVDDASIDRTAAEIAAFGASAAVPVRQLRNSCPGLARARNLGLMHAQGAIIAFTDDDCYPRPDFLRQLLQVFEAQDVDVVGGRVVLHDPSDAAVGVKDVDVPSDIATGFIRAGVVHGANMAVRREVVDAIGGFDPLLGAGTPCKAGEDIEFVARAVWRGWRAKYDPRPVVAHHHGRKSGVPADSQRRCYDYGRGAYFAKFLLDQRSRRMYLSGWWWDTRGLWGPGAAGRLGREVAGALRYVARRLCRPEPVPRFDQPRAAADVSDL